MSASRYFPDGNVFSVKVEGTAIEERVASGADVLEKVYPTIGSIGGAESGVLPVDPALQAFQADGGLAGEIEVAQVEGDGPHVNGPQLLGEAQVVDRQSAQGIQPNLVGRPPTRRRGRGGISSTMVSLTREGSFYHLIRKCDYYTLSCVRQENYAFKEPDQS
jgi:hypothetical protein